jgi:hypothetical protein
LVLLVLLVLARSALEPLAQESPRKASGPQNWRDLA